MDATQRLKEALESQQIREIPVIPLAGQWIAKFSGFPIQQVVEQGEKLYEAQIKAFEAVGYDTLFGYCDVFYIEEALGCQLQIFPTGMDIIPISIETLEDIDKLPIPNPEKDGRLPQILKAVKLLSNYSNKKTPVATFVEGPFTTAARMVGTDYLMRKVLKDKVFFHRFLDKITEILTTFLRATVEHGANLLVMPDACTSSTMISPKLASEISFPYLKKLITSLKIPSILHICGDSTNILQMMVETGASILSLDQCMDLSLARGKVGWETAIGGNFDPVNIMQFGNPDDVHREVGKCLKAGGNRGFVLMSGCSIAPNAPLENMKAVVSATRDFCFV
jgi:uroporphyrinogen decarboxylase